MSISKRPNGLNIFTAQPKLRADREKLKLFSANNVAKVAANCQESLLDTDIGDARDCIAGAVDDIMLMAELYGQDILIN